MQLATMEFPIFHGMWNAVAAAATTDHHPMASQASLLGCLVEGSRPLKFLSRPPWTQITYGIHQDRTNFLSLLAGSSKENPSVFLITGRLSLENETF